MRQCRVACGPGRFAWRRVPANQVGGEGRRVAAMGVNGIGRSSLVRPLASHGRIHQECHGRQVGDTDRAHWATILVSRFSDRALMHPGCRQVTALLA